MGVTAQGYRARAKRLYGSPLAKAQQKTQEIPMLGQKTAFGAQAHQNLNRMQAQKLDPLAKKVYRQNLNKLWQGASKYYPQTHGKMPPTSFTKSPEHAYSGVVNNNAPRGRRPVKFNVMTARSFAANKPGSPGYEENKSATPLHEWAHTIQRFGSKPKLKPGNDERTLRANIATLDKSKARTEGGADAYAQRVGSKLGLPSFPEGYPEYRTPVAHRIDRPMSPAQIARTNARFKENRALMNKRLTGTRKSRPFGPAVPRF